LNSFGLSQLLFSYELVLHAPNIKEIYLVDASPNYSHLLGLKLSTPKMCLTSQMLVPLGIGFTMVFITVSG